MDPTVHTSFMIILLIICVFGLVSNVINGVILARKQFHASTNYFLLGLTFSDTLLLAVSFVRTFHNLVPFLPTQIPQPFTFLFIINWVYTSGTRYFTVVISLERFLAVCFPLQARRWVIRSRSLFVAIGVGVFTLVLALIASFYQKYAPNAGFDIFAAVVLQFFPFTVIAVLNIFIYLGIRKFRENRAKLTHNEAKEFSITKMLFCVVIVFGFCNSFELVRRLMSYANYFDYTRFHYYDYVISYLADFFYVLNSAVNFVIYYLMVSEFRKEFLNLLRKFKCMITSKEAGSNSNSAVNTTTSGGPEDAQKVTNHTESTTASNTDNEVEACQVGVEGKQAKRGDQ